MVEISQIVMRRCGATSAVLYGMIYAAWRETKQPIKLSKISTAAIMGINDKTVSAAARRLEQAGYIIPHYRGNRVSYTVRDVI